MVFESTDHRKTSQILRIALRIFTAVRTFFFLSAVDITIYFNGFHGDLNETFFVGEVNEDSKQLVKVTYECINQAISSGNLIYVCDTGFSRCSIQRSIFRFAPKTPHPRHAVHAPTQLRPVPNVVLLPCRTQMKLSFRFKHGSSTPFETIKRGTADLGSARLLSTAGLAVPHCRSTTWFQTACYCCAELNS